ncbi:MULTISPECIES: 3-deoxy-7-phosphoheptulonate synthase [unclassified Streptomyces]|uniref:3-deoxy-7-phosphoheptulonate synthase n=1 Tax=unclassified Streptomyces TaxID=2593676 RepID=UPI002F914F08
MGRPPLVLPEEVRRLSEQMAAAARGEAFVLQMGDRAARSAGDVETNVVAGVRTLLQAALVLTYGAQVPVIKICRLPVRHGEALDAHSVTALNMVRAMTDTAGVADVRQVHRWNQEFVRTTEAGARYAALARRIDRVMRFMAAWPVDDTPLRTTRIFAGHEVLPRDHERPSPCPEQAPDPVPSDLSTHFLWLGERSWEKEGPHITFAESTDNPVGLEIGPGTLPEEAVEYVRRLDPHFRPGRVTLMSAMGSDRVREVLPPIVEKVNASGHQVVWQCDPVRANSLDSLGGPNNPSLFQLSDEVRGFFEVHRSLGSSPGGIRLERIDGNVAIELAFHIAESLRG